MVDDPGSGTDSIWNRAVEDPAAPAAPAVSTDDRGKGPSGQGRGRSWRIVAGVACLAIAAGAAAVLIGGDDAPAERPVGRALSTTPRIDETKVLESQTEATPSAQLVPTTVAPGAEVKCGQWDLAVNFQPKELTRGVSIWSDFDGWHVRLAGANPATVTGSVTGQVTPTLQSEATAPGVEVKQDDAAKRLTFNLTGGEVPVGFDFSAGCKQKELTFDLTTAGTAVAVDRIRLGSKGVVKEYPLVARRTLPAPG